MREHHKESPLHNQYRLFWRRKDVVLHCNIEGLEKAFQMMMLLWKERRDNKLKSSGRDPCSNTEGTMRKRFVTCAAKVDHLLDVFDTSNVTIFCVKKDRALNS